MPTRPLILFFLMISMMLLPSCGGVNRKAGGAFPDPGSFEMSSPEKEEISRLIEFLRLKNAKLVTYKGIGNIKLWDDKTMISSRAAWIGDSPMKLRLEMIGVHGRPIVSIALDGQRFYYYSHAEKRYYTRRLTDDGLKPFVSFSLPADVITELLMGRIPIEDYRMAKITKDPAGEGFVLTLLSKDIKIAEKIFLNPAKTQITGIEFYGKGGSLEARAVMSNQRAVESFEIPFSISISDGKGSGLTVDIDRYWTGMPVESSVFVLPHNAG